MMCPGRPVKVTKFAWEGAPPTEVKLPAAVAWESQ